MNRQNETVVSPSMMEQLRMADLDSGYKPVPEELEAKARQLLGDYHTGIANIDNEMKRRLRNRNKRMRREGVRGY